MIGELLREIVGEGPCGGVLFSGGLDSTSVAWAHGALGVRPRLIHVQLVTVPGPDLEHALVASRHLAMPLHIVWATLDDAMRAVREVVDILGVFNPMEVVNCAAQYLALEEAAALGLRRVCTGDGGDELFAGYSYMMRMRPEELDRYIRDLVTRWRFCAFDMGRRLGVEVAAPFTDHRMVKYALEVAPEDKVREGLGKYALRRAMDGLLPGQVVWRRKDPIEVGSGFRYLYKVLEDMGRDMEVDLPLNGAQRYLYGLFRELGKTYERRGECPACGYKLSRGYCHMCGYYGATP